MMGQPVGISQEIPLLTIFLDLVIIGPMLFKDAHAHVRKCNIFQLCTWKEKNVCYTFIVDYHRRTFSTMEIGHP
jgi:hypothetical protein